MRAFDSDLADPMKAAIDRSLRHDERFDPPPTDLDRAPARHRDRDLTQPLVLAPAPSTDQLGEGRLVRFIAKGCR